FLFDSAQYRHHGAVFWPDLPPYDRKEWLPEACWASVGMPRRDVPAFESGQLLVDRAAVGRELALTRLLLEHSDRYFRGGFGAKDCWCVAFSRVAHHEGRGIRYAMPRTPAGWQHKCILQHDFAGRLLFQHVTQDKPALAGYASGGYLRNERECHAHLAELRRR